MGILIDNILTSATEVSLLKLIRSEVNKNASCQRNSLLRSKVFEIL